MGRTRFDYLVELDGETAVRDLAPDLTRLARLPVRGVIVTARSSTADHDFVSRFFAPAVGIPEDPATGSAHCALAPYWAAKLGRSELRGYQASARGGTDSRPARGRPGPARRTGRDRHAGGADGMNPIEAFETLDLRVGRVLRAEPNERARKPSYKLWIDFGPLGEKTSSAQLRALYAAEELVGRLVVAAVNLGTRNIAGFTSEVLVLGPAGRRRARSCCWRSSVRCRSAGGCTECGETVRAARRAPAAAPDR